MADPIFDDFEIAVLLPCYNEEATIADVVAGFRRELPQATVYVYDNNSRDLTAILAAKAGARVVREPRQGKGHVVRRMFADIEADIYVMADGDGTYAPEDAPDLIRTLITERSDMVVGTRRGVTDDAGRAGHAFGNKLFNRIYTTLFGSDFTDIFSGYRVFNQRFAKSFPALSGGFEIETEMSVHASMLRMPVSELALDYGRRPEGSNSKLSTYRDGTKILWTLMMLMKETRPFVFYSAVSAAFLLASRLFRHRSCLEAADLDCRHCSLDDFHPVFRFRRHFGFFGQKPCRIQKDAVYGSPDHAQSVACHRQCTAPIPRQAKETFCCMKKRLFSFVVVGGIGFVTDAVLLMGLLRFTALDPFTARLVAIAAALQVTWLLNRNFTFGKSTRHAAVEGMRYSGVGIATSLLNYLVYSGLLVFIPDLRPVIALTIGSAVATIFSYTGYAKLVFGR
jgi:putative flippase GtrA/glycosyltransferase involved in cell wall biosynthesis